MEVFIAIGAAHALYIISLLLARQNRRMADKILILFFGVLAIVFSLVYISYALDLDELRLFLWNIGMLIPQIIYLYIKQLSKGQQKLKLTNLLHLSPWVLSSVYLVTLILKHTDRELVLLLNNHNYLSKPPIYLLFCIIDLLVSPVYTILIFKIIKRHKTKVKANYSYSENIDLGWVTRIMLAIIAMWFFIYAFYISSSMYFLTEDDSIKYGFVLAVSVIFYIGHHGTKQKNVFFAVDSPSKAPVQKGQNKSNTGAASSKYQKTGLNAEKAQTIFRNINNCMEYEKPFLSQKLSIQQLSELANIPTHHISQALNDVGKQSFFTYVNTYRVNAFIEKIKNNEHKKNTLLGLAYDCGFNSKSSFNRIFKEIKGVSPTEFIKSGS